MISFLLCTDSLFEVIALKNILDGTMSMFASMKALDASRSSITSTNLLNILSYVNPRVKVRVSNDGILTGRVVVVVVVGE